MSQRYYDILGVSKKATITEIKDAYERLCKEYEPSDHQFDPEYVKRYNEVQEAFDWLKNNHMWTINLDEQSNDETVPPQQPDKQEKLIDLRYVLLAVVILSSAICYLFMSPYLGSGSSQTVVVNNHEYSRFSQAENNEMVLRYMWLCLSEQKLTNSDYKDWKKNVSASNEVQKNIFDHFSSKENLSEILKKAKANGATTAQLLTITNAIQGKNRVFGMTEWYNGFGTDREYYLYNGKLVSKQTLLDKYGDDFDSKIIEHGIEKAYSYGDKLVAESSLIEKYGDDFESVIGSKGISRYGTKPQEQLTPEMMSGMDEDVLQDLYDRAVSKGYSKSIEEFSTLLSTNEKVLKDNFNYAREKGYQKSIEDFSALVAISKLQNQGLTQSPNSMTSLSHGGNPYGYCYTSSISCSSSCSEIKVNASNRIGVIVIIKGFDPDSYLDNGDGTKVVRCAYIDKGRTFTFKLPNGTYTPYFYSGTGWSNKKYMKTTTQCGRLYGGFTAGESVGKDTPQTLNNQILSYDLNTQYDGNFQTKSSDVSEAF